MVIWYAGLAAFAPAAADAWPEGNSAVAAKAARAVATARVLRGCRTGTPFSSERSSGGTSRLSLKNEQGVEHSQAESKPPVRKMQAPGSGEIRAPPVGEVSSAPPPPAEAPTRGWS